MTKTATTLMATGVVKELFWWQRQKWLSISGVRLYRFCHQYSWNAKIKIRLPTYCTTTFTDSFQQLSPTTVIVITTLFCANTCHQYHSLKMIFASIQNQEKMFRQNQKLEILESTFLTSDKIVCRIKSCTCHGTRHINVTWGYKRDVLWYEL